MLVLCSAGLAVLLGWLRVGWCVIVPATTGGQFLAHDVLSRWPARASHPPHSGPLGHDPGYDPFAPGQGELHAHASLVTGLDVEMFAWHVGCAVLLLAALKYGETGLTVAVRVAVRIAVQVLGRVRPRASQPPRMVDLRRVRLWWAPVEAAAAPDTGGPGRRGPPRVLLARP